MIQWAKCAPVVGWIVETEVGREVRREPVAKLRVESVLDRGVLEVHRARAETSRLALPVSRRSMATANEWERLCAVESSGLFPKHCRLSFRGRPREGPQPEVRTFDEAVQSRRKLRDAARLGNFDRGLACAEKCVGRAENEIGRASCRERV